jgi:hypothetical protein
LALLQSSRLSIQAVTQQTCSLSAAGRVRLADPARGLISFVLRVVRVSRQTHDLLDNVEQ